MHFIQTKYSQSARSRSVAAFFTRSLKALVDMPNKQACFFHNSINFSSNSSLQNFIVKTRHIWRHDLQTESTGSRRSELIGDSCSRCERVDNSTSSWVELSCVAINGPSCHVSSVICQPHHQLWMSYPVLSYNGLNLVLLTALNWWSIIC